MFELLKNNPLAVLVSALVHLLVVVFMVVGMQWQVVPEKKHRQVDVVQARVVDESQLQSEIKKQQEKKQQKKAAEQQRLADIKRKQEAEKKRLSDLQQQRKQAEQKKQQEQKKRAEAEKQRKLAEKKASEAEKKRKQAEAKRVAEEKKRKQAEAERLAEEKKLKAAEAKKAAEKKRKQEEAKRLAEEKRIKQEQARIARERAEQQAREQEIAEQIQAEAMAGEVQSAVNAITGKVQRNWLKPVGSSSDLKCTVNVRLLPSGDIYPNSVKIVKSSGNGAFDRSVEKAIYKSEPLPVPAGRAFESFRNLTFIFDPID